MKNCPTCNKILSIDNFYLSPIFKDGRSKHCKECDRARQRKFRKEQPNKAKNNELRNRYGKEFGLQEYNDLLVKQDNKCAICKRKESKKYKKKRAYMLAVDHCHKTGKIRGLLCSACNTAIGKFGDNIQRIKETISYLRRNK